MTLNPGVAALLLSSLMTSLVSLYCALFGVRVLLGWDLKNGSERQLRMERRTYLVSTLLGYTFFFEMVSLFLFVHVMDAMHPMFVGAMCAVGTLNAGEFGYPALMLKVAVFMLAGLWLILNHTDNLAPDYPLIRYKYALLLVVAPLAAASSVLLTMFLLSLQPNVITSCCGTLFSSGGGGLASELAGLPPVPTEAAFYALGALTLIAGAVVYWKDRGGYALGALSLASFLVSVAAIISFISCYIYELPTHHCPFCVLQRDYNYIGYPLYGALFGATLAGMGVGVLAAFKDVPSMRVEGARVRRRLALASIVLWLVFMAMVTYKILATDFVLNP